MYNLLPIWNPLLLDISDGMTTALVKMVRKAYLLIIVRLLFHCNNICICHSLNRIISLILHYSLLTPYSRNQVAKKQESVISYRIS